MRLGDLYMVLRNELKVFISCPFAYAAGIVCLELKTESSVRGSVLLFSVCWRQPY